MTLTLWMQLWHACLIAALVLFTVLAVCVTIGGAYDILRLFQKLRNAPDGEDGSSTNDALHPW